MRASLLVDLTSGRCLDLPERPHLIGAAGCGMQALLEVLLAAGCRVSGSDLLALPSLFSGTNAALLHQGHSPLHVPKDCDLVIHSDAVRAANPELREAARLGVPVVSYPRMIGRLIAHRVGIGVAGTHGKSTTTAMLGHVLHTAGLDPTVICGAVPVGHASGGRFGAGQLAVAEACEHRRNFLLLAPVHGVVLGIEPDHFDYFFDDADLTSAFREFAAKLPGHGLLLANADCPRTMSATDGVACRRVTFGRSDRAEWRAVDLTHRLGRYQFTILRRNEPFARVGLRVPGAHNVTNALAAAALAAELGVAGDVLQRALGQFRGLKRRLEVVGDFCGVAILDDYAHHPTEVTCSLAAVRKMLPGRRLVCVFQPHQVSRTRHLLDEFAASLQNADSVVVAEIFTARESDPGDRAIVRAELVQRLTESGSDVVGHSEHGPIVDYLTGSLRPGDVLITMGAGNIRKLGDELVHRFHRRRAAG